MFSHVRVNLHGLDARESLVWHDLAEVLERPVQGDGPALAAGVWGWIAFVDFEGDAFLGLLDGCSQIDGAYVLSSMPGLGLGRRFRRRR